jgi:hypothetical protein
MVTLLAPDIVTLAVLRAQDGFVLDEDAIE